MVDKAVQEAILQAIENCPICNGTLKLEDINYEITGHGCDTGCEIALIELRPECGDNVSAHDFVSDEARYYSREQHIETALHVVELGQSKGTISQWDRFYSFEEWEQKKKESYEKGLQIQKERESKG